MSWVLIALTGRTGDGFTLEANQVPKLLVAFFGCPSKNGLLVFLAFNVEDNRVKVAFSSLTCIECSTCGLEVIASQADKCGVRIAGAFRDASRDNVSCDLDFFAILDDVSAQKDLAILLAMPLPQRQDLLRVLAFADYAANRCLFFA